MHVHLREWQTVHLPGVSLADPEAMRAASQLTSTGKLTVHELRSGLRIDSHAHVGHVQLGDVTIHIEPKIAARDFLKLFCHVWGLDVLRQPGHVPHGQGAFWLQDMLIAQLCIEVREALAHGLRRRYVARTSWQQSPRGRIDWRALSAQGALTSAALPCRHHEPSEDWPAHRAIAAGLRLAASEAHEPAIAADARRLYLQLAERVSARPLTPALCEEARRSLDRLSAPLGPSLSLIEILAQGSSLAPEDEGESRLPGFLFDMNRFFQASIGQFLKESLPGYELREDRAIGEMFRYAPSHNPRARQSPRQRPDFALFQRGQLVALLDAKYRDLWELPLPREMLYQLAIYALGREGPEGAVILYPAQDRAAREATIELRAPFGPWGKTHVGIRPVFIEDLASVITMPKTSDARRRLAEQLVMGSRR